MSTALARKPAQRAKAAKPAAVMYDRKPPEFDEYFLRNGYNSGQCQIAVISRIVARTFGAGFEPSNTPEWALLTVSELVKLTGFDAKSIRVAIRDALKRGVIAREKRGRAWWYKPLPENWPAMAPYTAPTVAEREQWEEDDEPELRIVPATASVQSKAAASARRSPSSAVNPESEEGRSGETIVLLNGGKKAVPLRFLVRGKPVTIGFECENRSGIGLAFTPLAEGEILRLLVRQAGSKASASGQFSSDVTGRTRPPSEESFAENNRVTDLVAYLSDVLPRFFHSQFDPALAKDKSYLRRFQTALGSAPLHSFAVWARRRLNTVNPEKDNGGLLLTLADEYRTKHERQANARRNSSRSSVPADLLKGFEE